MVVQSKKLRQLLRKVPGYKTFGVYRFLPVFFVFGAGLEFLMINWRVGEVNFYRTFKRRKVAELVEERLRLEREGITETFAPSENHVK